MNRRHFLKSASAFIGIFLWNPLQVMATGPREFCHNEIRAILSDMSAAQKIGKAYLTAHPHEKCFEFLYQDVFEGRIDRQTLAIMKARDFQDEDMVMVQGWYLARTEARLMALAALV